MAQSEKAEKVLLTKKQLCAGIQFLERLYYPYLNDLNPDSEEASDSLKFIYSCNRMNKKLWTLMGKGDYEINVPFEIPDFSE